MAALEIRDAEAQLRRAPAVGARRTLGESNHDVWRFDAGIQGPITTNLLQLMALVEFITTSRILFRERSRLTDTNGH